MWTDGGWPIKPEIVLEGGNYATDNHGNYSNAPDLSILTTALEKTGATLGLTRATSAAAGQAAGMAAQIQAAYPNYWPETVRGLMVHCARWTKEMREEFPVEKKGGRVIKIPPLRLRCYGWGVPNLLDCMGCEKNFATMVIQDTIQPFCLKDEGRKTATKEMRFHTLPIPKEKLAEIGDEKVEMRVTLSYFIEPSPGRKGWNKNHRYASHGLRFAVLRPLEDIATFQKRISRDFWDSDENDQTKRERPSKGAEEDRHWAIGEFGQTKGSMHSDFWIGTASQLADSDAIAIYPVTGWWREAPVSLNLVNQPVKEQLKLAMEVATALRQRQPEAYVKLADGVEQDLHLATLGIPPDNLGKIDTFRFEEISLLEHVGNLIIAGKFSTALEIVKHRRRSFWAHHQLERQEQWQAYGLVAELGIAIGEIAKQLPDAKKTAINWVEGYTAENGWYRADLLHRRLESTLASMSDTIASEKVVHKVRQDYESLIDKMSTGFIRAFKESAWTIPGVLHQTDVYSSEVHNPAEPVDGRIKSGGSR